MGLSAAEKEKTEYFLRKKNIDVENLQSFTFMKRYYMKVRNSKPQMHNLRGPGVFTFYLKNGAVHGIQLYPYHSKYIGRIIKYLLEKEVPFANNEILQEKSNENLSYKTYYRFSFQMLYLSILIIIMLSGSIRLFQVHEWETYFAGSLFGIAGITFFYFIFCRSLSLTLDNHAITLQNVFRKKIFPFEEILKVNFDEICNYRYDPLFIEILDSQFNYYVYFLDWVPKKKVKEIISFLRQKGIHATNGMDDIKSI